jgi:hypothetical protein
MTQAKMRGVQTDFVAIAIADLLSWDAFHDLEVA